MNAIEAKSDIQIRKSENDGRWVIYRVSTGAWISDYATEPLARAAIKGIRKYARERAAALKEQDQPLRW